MPLNRFLRSSRYAWRGLRHAFRHEANFRVQTALAMAVIALAFLLRISRLEWACVALSIVLVLVLELVNTCLEFFLDLLAPRLNPHAGAIKDMMAGAVLLAAVGALVVGLTVFAPYLVRIIKYGIL